MPTLSFSDAQNYADQIKATRSSVRALYEELDKIYFLSDADLPKGDNIKSTVSPDGRNKVLGAARLLSSSDPQWSVPFDANDPEAKASSSNLERLAQACWVGAGRIRGKAVHYELLKSALRYDEMHLAVYTAADALAAATDKEKLRVEDAAAITPLFFEALNPKMCYPVFDSYGLKAHLTSRVMKIVDVISRWGAPAEKLLGNRPNLYDVVTYNEFWDIDNHCAWVDGVSEFIYSGENPWPFIPIVCSIVEGSEFDDENDSRQPFLYTMHKSGLWKRQNLALTALYTWTFTFGVPKIVYQANQPDKPLDLDLGEIVINIERDESVTPLAKQTIDPALSQALQTASGLVEQSTMYSQTLGQPLGGNAPFSMVSLLSQAGRLPLVVYQRVGNAVLSEAMRKGLKMLQIENASIEILGGGKSGEALILKGKDLPERIDIRANLDITMPQDERLSVQTAQQATAGDRPLLSIRAAREKYLGVGQSDDMTKEIWEERLSEMALQMQYQQQIQAVQGQGGQPGMPPQGQGMPQPGPEQAPGGITPEMLQQLQAMQGGPGGAQEGLPMQEPAPGPDMLGQGEPGGGM